MRIPTRTDRDDRYFTDRLQAMPDKGYTAMFAPILDHPLIKLRLDAQRAPTAYARAAEKACGGLLPFATIAPGSRQSAAGTVRDRHPDALVAILPTGPEFASPETLHPLGVPKDIDVICVAAAQGYKRHNILFDALDALPRSIRALCVFGYGDDADALRQRAADLNLNIELVGPPGVSYREVNRLMNRARIGDVCGIDDGAPAILTEYMQAGLPVLANERLRFGLHYIRPETGRMASAMDFGAILAGMLADLSGYSPRETVLANWSWPGSSSALRA